MIQTVRDIYSPLKINNFKVLMLAILLQFLRLLQGKTQCYYVMARDDLNGTRKGHNQKMGVITLKLLHGVFRRLSRFI